MCYYTFNYTQLLWGATQVTKKGSALYIPEDSENLVNLRIPMEKWLFSCQLSKYGSYAPDVYRSRVTSRSQQHFWRPVPQCHYLWNKES